METSNSLRCSLCGSENKAFSQICEICDTPLQESFAEQSEPQTQSQVSYFYFSKRFYLLLFFLLPILFFYDLLLTPRDVALSRAGYFSLKESYEQQRDKWDHQKDEILFAMREHRQMGEIGKEMLYFEAIPSEILMAFLQDQIEFSQDLAIFLSEKLEHPRVILSKKENLFWPLKTLLSLEIELAMESGELKARILRLRKGSRSLDSKHAWTSFSKELRALRSFETFYGGLKELRMYRKQSESQSPSFMLSWKYLHHSIFAGEFL